MKFVDTAKGSVFLTEGADLPVQYGLMNGGVVLPQSQDSLLPVVPVCQDDDLGFEVAQGATGARFYVWEMWQFWEAIEVMNYNLL